jgi:hypothetical protein
MDLICGSSSMIRMLSIRPCTLTLLDRLSHAGKEETFYYHYTINYDEFQHQLAEKEKN